MRKLSALLAATVAAMLLSVGTAKAADRPSDAAVRMLQRGVSGGFCKLPEGFTSLQHDSGDQMVDRFRKRVDPWAPFNVLLKKCDEPFRASLRKCAENPAVCGDDSGMDPSSAQVSPGMTGLVGLETLLKLLNVGRGGDGLLTMADVVNLVRSTASKQNMSLQDAANELISQYGKPLRTPSIAPTFNNMNTVAPLISAQGGGATVATEQRAEQVASSRMTQNQRAQAAAAAQAEAQAQAGVVQGPLDPYSVVSTPDHLFPDASAQLKHQLWRGAKLTSILHLAGNIGLGLNDRRYDETGDPRYAVLIGFEAGFRAPGTPIRLVGDVTMFHNVLTDDVPEVSKAHVQNDWGLRVGGKVWYEAFSDTNYPVALGIGYEHQDLFPARKKQPHAFALAIKLGPFTNAEVLKRIALEYQLQVAPTAGSLRDQTLTHIIALNIMAWRTRFMNGRW